MAANVQHAGPISLAGTLDLLHREGTLSANQCARVRTSLNPDDDRHPFVQLTDLGLQSSGKSRQPLVLESITRLVAEACGLPYLRIDPLKVDVEAVTSLVSQAYATRFQFLPLIVNEREVTIATAEPFDTEWETEVARVLKRPIKRASDIERYLREFYGVSRSISGASAKREGGMSIVSNFEQLTELGSVGEPDANDQHIVHLVDWLLQYAFEQRASDIHIEPRREQSNIRFRIDGVLHLIHQLPTAVIGAITSRVKSLGRMDVADKRRPKMAGSERRRRRARKSNCACQRCRRPSVKSSCCAFSVPRSSPNRSKHSASPGTTYVYGTRSPHNRTE